ncbi:MAG: TRAP transporter small permease [Geminicoccaceae bacterium]|nr:TRAP transporter small permease [Geminicoccaceae bacterium]MCX8101541.1 TRAP transporter small permease [Geminicoccaceae bacterium]MDW8371310.1 TRAP transporter small permease [Geminicoccaceae bacterium]
MSGRTTLVDRVTIAISRVTMLLFGIIVVATFYEVVMRYLFGSPTIWANELSLMVAGIGYLFAGVYAMQRREHIRITPLYDLAPPALKRLFDLLALVCILAFAVGMVIGGWPSAWRSLSTFERFGTAWDPPIPALLKPLILVTTVLIAIQAVSNFLADRRRGG